MNRADIRNLVIEHTGRADKVSLINSMITAALKKVSSEKHWRDLLVESSVTLIPNQVFIQLDTAVRRLSEVRLIDGLSSYKIEVRPKNWVVERWPDLNSQFSNYPRFAYLQGTQLFLMPPPSTNWVLKYTYFPRATLLTDETTELVPDILDEAVIAYATYRTFKSLQQTEDASVWFADYQEALRNAKSMDTDPAVEQKAIQRGSGQTFKSNYWLDPWTKETP